MNSIRSRLTGILIGVTCLVWLFAVVWIHISTQSQLEKVLDAPELGAGVSVSIKRGCSEYEIHCGPSSKFTFSDDLAAAELELLKRLRQPAPPKPKQHTLTVMNWIQIAYQLGDESYKKFTQGKPLYPEPVCYSAQQQPIPNCQNMGS